MSKYLWSVLSMCGYFLLEWLYLFFVELYFDEFNILFLSIVRYVFEVFCLIRFVCFGLLFEYG